MATENWLSVVGWEGLYEVSDQGRVRSVPRRILARDGRVYNFTRYIVLQQTPHPQGYQLVSLQEAGYVRVSKVHQLVGQAFIGPRPEGQVVRHKNDVPSDNRAENLCYGTQTENQQDAIRNGRNFYVNKVVCKRDHLLAGANLRRPSSRHPHRRGCVACNRGLAAAHRTGKAGDEAAVRSLADAYYVELMAAAA